MISCVRELISLIEQRGIEYLLYVILYKPFYMPVSQLCGIALGLGGDGLYPQGLDIMT